MANKPVNKTADSTSFKIGDRVRLLRLDGTVGDEVVTVHDLWGDETSNRNASFVYAGAEQFTHTDLMKHEADTSPVVVPDGGVWFIARGNNMGWGRAQSIDAAIANMRRQGGKVSDYVVHQVSKWTQVDGMGSLSYPQGIDPVEVRRSAKEKTA
jgi:hypothetical protein